MTDTAAAAQATESRISDLIDAHLAEFRAPGVLSVRPGWEIRKGWFTGRPAIVVTVRRKRRTVPDGERLPETIDGVNVDVRQASSAKRLEQLDPAAYAAQLRLTPDTGSIPHFGSERTLTATGTGGSASAHAALAAATASKPELDYTAPPGVPLQPTTVTGQVTLSASPDNGWLTLQAFLAGTTRTLTVGMYDFTSAHVLSAVTGLSGVDLHLTLDHPGLDKTADQTDVAAVAALRDSFADRIAQTWALTRPDPDATAWIYPTAYHIKVAVRDGATTWLSSGNWNNSNQPAIDPVTDGLTSAAATEARHRDRDWHVVLDDGAVATTFAAYLDNDLTVGAANNTGPETPGPALPAPPLPTDTTPVFRQFFPAVTIPGPVSVTPLLTPDPGVYVDAVQQLIESATTSLYLQFQYIELPSVVNATSQRFVDLVDAVIARQNAGVEVKIICSQYEKAGYLEQLITRGLNVKDVMRKQNNVHNKGIIVDAAKVLVSSQNWSTDGTLYNRDAGVIIDDPRAAAYYTQLFDHDWAHLAKRVTVPD